MIILEIYVAANDVQPVQNIFPYAQVRKKSIRNQTTSIRFGDSRLFYLESTSSRPLDQTTWHSKDPMKADAYDAAISSVASATAY